MTRRLAARGFFSLLPYVALAMVACPGCAAERAECSGVFYEVCQVSSRCSFLPPGSRDCSVCGMRQGCDEDAAPEVERRLRALSCAEWDERVEVEILPFLEEWLDTCVRPDTFDSGR